MPCEYLIDTERRLVISRGSGTFRYSDFLAHMDVMRPDPRFKPAFDHLVDCRTFDHFDVTIPEVHDIGTQSLFAPSSRRAFVVSSDLHFGLGRMFAAYRELKHGQTTMVFRDMAQALKWLGLPGDYDQASAGEPVQFGG